MSGLKFLERQFAEVMPDLLAFSVDARPFFPR